MAGSLNLICHYKQSPASWLWGFLLCLGTGLQVSCGDSASTDTPALVLPERQGSVYITDQVSLTGRVLQLWNDNGQCTLQQSGTSTAQGGQIDVPGMELAAPCYFIKSPGTEKVQIFQRDKVTQIVAVLGNPLPADTSSGQHCGQSLQGVLISSRGKVRLSERTLREGRYCADKGLANAGYASF